MTVLTSILGSTPYLPQKVVEVPRDVIRAFQHSKKVGNYLLGRTIGEGSFAKVKEALHIPTGEKVAIKVVDKRKAKEDSYVRKNLRREGKLLQQVRHPNIVQLYEVMETENSYYIVTELCRGGDLMDYICQRKKLDEREVKRFIRQILSAVDYLHRLGILHRDLKVENLLLDENKEIKIIDFGLANSVRVTETKEGIKTQELLITQCGSPAYAAPELLGRKKYGTQVDIWSIGVNMYAMLTGSLPFTVDPFNIKVLYNKMVTGQMNALPDNISRDCRDLIRKFLTPEPESRITVAEAMRHPWIAEGRTKPLESSPCPNKLRNDDLIENILKYMSEVQGFRMSEVIRFVTSNTPSAALAMYHILHRKLGAYMADLRVKGKIPALEEQLLGHVRNTSTSQNANMHIFRHKPVTVFSPSTKRHVSTTHPSKQTTGGRGHNHGVENDVTITDIDDNNNNCSGPGKPCPSSPSEGSGENTSKSPKTSLTNKTGYMIRRQSLPKACVASKDGASQTGSNQGVTNETASNKQDNSPCASLVRNRSPPNRLPQRSRRIRQPVRSLSRAKNVINITHKTAETQSSEIISLDGYNGVQHKSKFQKVCTPCVEKDDIDSGDRSEVKQVTQKRLINLAYSPPKSSVKRRTVSLGSASKDIDSVVDNAETSTQSAQRHVETFSDRTSVDRASPLSSISKNTSSRATSKSDKSFVRDARVTLPCISPPTNTRQC